MKPPLTFAELWQNARLKVTDELIVPPVVLQVGDSIVGTLGNFSASTGKAHRPSTKAMAVTARSLAVIFSAPMGDRQ